MRHSAVAEIDYLARVANHCLERLEELGNEECCVVKFQALSPSKSVPRILASRVLLPSRQGMGKVSVGKSDQLWKEHLKQLSWGITLRYPARKLDPLLAVNCQNTPELLPF